MNRRDYLKLLTAGGVALTYPVSSWASIIKRPILRVAHLTDVHMDTVYQAEQNYTACLQYLQEMKNPVDFIIDGGDAIMDALNVKEKDRVDAQWELREATYRNACDLDLYHCLGNHDVWAGISTDDPLYGKKYAVERLGLQAPYYSFDRRGWHFIILDSTHPTENGWYYARLDEAQMDWLKADLNATDKDTPVLVVSHIPIFSATGLIPNTYREKRWQVPRALLHEDFKEIMALFESHGNVKACLSGHMHMIDRVDFRGTTYFCDGAVSGNWWKSRNYYDAPAGFAVFNLFRDGRVEREFYHYPWT